MNKSMGGAALAMSMCVAMLNLGCTDWVAIRPTELPRLNGSTAIQTGTTSQLGPNGSTTVVPIMAVSETSVETPGGTLVTIRGDFDVEIDYRGRTVRAEDPVLSELVGPNLQVRAGNLPRTSFALAEVTRVEVAQPAPVKTVLLTTGLTLIGTAIIMGLLFGVVLTN